MDSRQSVTSCTCQVPVPPTTVIIHRSAITGRLRQNAKVLFGFGLSDIFYFRQRVPYVERS